MIHTGVYSASAPGIGEKVIGVASYNNTHTNLPTFTISSDNKAIGYTQATGAPPPPTSGSSPMARTGTTTPPSLPTDDACDATKLDKNSLAGKVALIRRGTCSFYIKARNAEEAGAEGVVLYNNVVGSFNPNVSPPTPEEPAITIPVVAISDTDGGVINDRLAASGEAVTMTWTTQTASLPNPNGGLIASSSSYGLTPDLQLKPDIGAPGGFIRSTYPLEKGAYANNSGTSMASPHVAGAAALLLEARPNTPAQAIHDILQNSADPQLFNGNPGAGFLDNVHRQGAGMLDIDDAIRSTTKIEPGKLSLGESGPEPHPAELTIANNSSSDVTYDLSHQPAGSTRGNTFSPTFVGHAPSRAPKVAFNGVPAPSNGDPATSVTVQAGDTATVDVAITPPNPSSSENHQYGGYLKVSPQGEGLQPYRVPYAGFKGDYQSIQASTPMGNGLPYLAKYSGSGSSLQSFPKQSNGATYTLKDGDLPYILVHLDHPARRIVWEVKDAKSGKSWHRALDTEYIARNPAANGFFALAWDGRIQYGNEDEDEEPQYVPNGTYTITMRVQKALVKDQDKCSINSTKDADDDPACWEQWDSPLITVNQPSS